MSVVQEERGVEARRPVVFTLAVSPEVDQLLAELGGELGATKADVLLKGIALLKAATDARREGKAVGAASSAEALETEFVGF